MAAKSHSISDPSSSPAASDPLIPRPPAGTARRAREADDRYRQLMEAAPDPVFVVGLHGDRAGRILDANTLAATMHGYSRQELLTMRVGDLDLPEHAAMVPQRLAELLRDGEARFVVRHRRKDGSSFPVEVSARTGTMHGEPCVVAFNRDISEPEFTRSQLELERARLAIAARAGGVGFWDWDIASDAVYFSPEWKAQIGYADHEIPGHYREWERRVHPDDLPKALQGIREHLAGVRPHHEAEFRLRHKDGSWRWIHARGQLLRGPAGEPLRMLGCHLDRTAERMAAMDAALATERMRAIYETDPQCIKTVGRDGELLDMNPAGLRLIGAPDLDAVRGQRIAQIVHPDDRAAVAALHERVLAGSPGELEFRIVSLDGTPRELAMHSVPLRDATGAITSVLSVTREITAERAAERQREAMTRRLAHLQQLEAIGTLSGGIAHDFNNLLAVISGNLQLARLQPGVDGELAECLGEIRKATDRACSLVKQILTFGRRHELQRRAVDVGAVAAEVARFLRATIPTTIAIDLQVAPGLPALCGDATQLHQVLVNLGTNAWHAMETTGGRLAITIDVVEGAPEGSELPAEARTGRHLRVRVKDSGIGMDKATLAHVFEPFFTTKPVGKGTGLGLSVVHGIVRDHGGCIAIQSEPGAGTTFEVFLPIGTSPADRAGGAEEPSAQGTHRVLLVDDEPAVLAVTRRLLGKSGCHVTTCTDARQALALVQQRANDFDVLITDNEMPDMTGLALAQQLRAIAPELPVVLCSGFLRPDVAGVDASVGVDALVQKPASTAQLLAAIRAVTPARAGA